jgi:hypothetical protein
VAGANILQRDRTIPTAGVAHWALLGYSRIVVTLSSNRLRSTLPAGLGPMTISIASENNKPTCVCMEHRAPTFGEIRSARGNTAKPLGGHCRRIAQRSPYRDRLDLLSVHFRSYQLNRRNCSMCSQLSGARSGIYRWRRSKCVALGAYNLHLCRPHRSRPAPK